MSKLLLSLLLTLSVAFASTAGYVIWGDTVVWGN
jgi:hypothetical protein